MSNVVRLKPPQSEKPTVQRGSKPNAKYRKREYPTEAEIDKLLAAAGQSRNPVRDRLLVLLARAAGLRAGGRPASRPI
jgi:integrase